MPRTTSPDDAQANRSALFGVVGRGEFQTFAFERDTSAWVEFEGTAFDRGNVSVCITHDEGPGDGEPWFNRRVVVRDGVDASGRMTFWWEASHPGEVDPDTLRDDRDTVIGLFAAPGDVPDGTLKFLSALFSMLSVKAREARLGKRGYRGTPAMVAALDEAVRGR